MTNKNKKFISVHSSAIRLFLKLALLFGVPMGLLSSIAFCLESETFYATFASIIAISLTAGIAFAAPMTILQMITTDRAVRAYKIERGSISDVYGVVHNKTITFQGSLDQAHDQCIAACESFKKRKAEKIAANKTSIEVLTSLNFLTTGEKIKVFLFEKDDSVEVRVSSRPTLKSTVIDFGKNLKNVEAIGKFLGGVGPRIK